MATSITLPKTKTDEIIAVFNEKRQKTIDQYGDKFYPLEKKENAFISTTLSSLVFVAVPTFIYILIAHARIFLLKSVANNIFGEILNNILISRIVMSVFIISAIICIVFTILSSITSNKMDDIYYDVTNEWEGCDNFGYNKAADLFDKDCNVRTLMPHWIRYIDRLHQLNTDDIRYSYSYEKKNENWVTIGIYVNGHRYTSIDIHYDGIDEFAKASELNFTYYDDRWSELKKKIT